MRTVFGCVRLEIMMTPEERERTARYIARLEKRFRTLRDEVEEDVADYRGLSMDRRAALVADLSRVAYQQRKWSGQKVPKPDPPAPGFRELWSRLHARFLDEQPSE